jgi:hypothetical protein
MTFRFLTIFTDIPIFDSFLMTFRFLTFLQTFRFLTFLMTFRFLTIFTDIPIFALACTHIFYS